MSKNGKLISSSLSKTLNTLKPQLKQFASELSTSAKQIGAQQLQVATSNYLKQKQQNPALPVYATPKQVVNATIAPPIIITPPVTLPSPQYTPPPQIVENIVRASKESAISANVLPEATTMVPKTEISPGISLKPGIVAESVSHTQNGNITHALLKDITPKPFYKKTWFIVTMILLVIIIMAAIGLTIYLIVRARNKKDEEKP